MPLASAPVSRELTPEERRERRGLRREKQRENNILRAAKMHKFRTQCGAPEQEQRGLRRLLGLALLEMARLLL